MKILITNDDGINAEQLPHLAAWASKLGEVTVVAPKHEQSGKSHGINIHHPFEVKPVSLLPGITAYSVDSTPADCIRFAVFGLKLEFDYVISGVNRGLNIGSDVLYSGTVAAVFEAERLGMKGVALSTDPCCYDSATAHLDRIFDFMSQHRLFARNSIYNVNIPVDPRGIRITRQGGPYYSDDYISVGENMYLAQGKSIFRDSGNPELDTDSTLGGYITITPLTISRTDMELFRELSALSV